MEQVKNEPTIYSATVYCRLSKDDEQAGESVSIETQKMMLTDFCHERGFSIYEIYADDGYSGLNFNRPAFARLLEDYSIKLMIEPVKALTDIFIEEWLSYEERLSVFKENKNTENEKKFSAAAVLDLLSSLDAAMEDMDIDSADEIIKNIQCYVMPDNLKELVEQLVSAVINLDIQMENEIVEKLREEIKTI